MDVVHLVLIKCRGDEDAKQQHIAVLDRLVEIRTVSGFTDQGWPLHHCFTDSGEDPSTGAEI